MNLKLCNQPHSLSFFDIMLLKSFSLYTNIFDRSNSSIVVLGSTNNIASGKLGLSPHVQCASLFLSLLKELANLKITFSKANSFLPLRTESAAALIADVLADWFCRERYTSQARDLEPPSNSTNVFSMKFSTFDHDDIASIAKIANSGRLDIGLSPELPMIILAFGDTREIGCGINTPNSLLARLIPHLRLKYF